MSLKTVGIIGAGPCGLAAAKYAIENGLTPFVFDAKPDIGGLWQANTFTWDGLHTNVTRYLVSFADHPWPEGSSMYPNKMEINAYLHSYADRFNLKQHITLNCRVKKVNKLTEQVNDENVTRWELELENGENRTFDFLICASGLHSKPSIPAFKNLELFEGLSFHSSEFLLNDPRLKGKKVVVIGTSLSGSEIASFIVDQAREVVNIFPRPYLAIPRLVHSKKENGKYSIIPVDFIDFTRKVAYVDRHPGLTPEMRRAVVKQIYMGLFPQQTNRETVVHPDLFVDLDDESKQLPMDVPATFTDTYLEAIEAGKIRPIKTTITEMTKDGLLLGNGTHETADVIIFATGFDCTSTSYLDESVTDLYRVKNVDNLRHQFTLAKLTFHPELDNFALICHLEALYWNGGQIQGKFVTEVFR
jgi:dimethylaniline monooxygenase (N-oxide forming)